MFDRVSMIAWSWEPSQASRTLPAIPDEQLADELREAIVAIGYWFDAWWPEARPKALPIQLKRAEKVETMREQVALLGALATMAQLAEAVQPLLGDFMETAELRAAVELARDVSMHRWSLIKYERESIRRWDEMNRR